MTYLPNVSISSAYKNGLGHQLQIYNAKHNQAISFHVGSITLDLFANIRLTRKLRKLMGES